MPASIPTSVPTTIPQGFKKAVVLHGNRVAMRKKEYGLWHDISWNTYEEQVRHVGSALISLGFEKGDCAAIIGDNCPEWLFTAMGIQCVGGVAVGVYATNSWPQVEYVVGNSESVFFFVENEEQLDKWLMFRDKAPHLKKIIVWDTKGLRQFEDLQVMTFDELLERGCKAYAETPNLFKIRRQEVSSEDIAALIYTSGTTGPPKGTMLSHGNLIWMGDAITSNNPMYDTDDMMSFLPLCHIFEQLFSIYGHITVGYTVNFIESPDTITDNMIEISPTVGHAVPRIWEKYYSAVLIRMANATWFKRMVFGLALKIGTVGPALKGAEIKIANDGEILMKSPGIFMGYFKNPAVTAETVKSGWLYSGDVGEIDADGYLKITDRKKDIIVTAGGKNIAPQFIENKLKSSIYINDAVIIGDRRKFISCLIMIDEDTVVKYAQDHKVQFSTYRDLTLHGEINTLIWEEVKKVNETLSRVEQVKKFTILPKKLYEEDGEVTPTMKVKRKFVNEAFSDLIEAMYGNRQT
ncbi:MAG: long-chain fatty acid--CoA ligase [Deltaproteobacteria bacterium]|nr:long-chain fatty acid--CoA ligase [Deltaproteobacteria bacterium]